MIREGTVTCAAAARMRIMHEDTRQIILDFFAHHSDIQSDHSVGCLDFSAFSCIQSW